MAAALNNKKPKTKIIFTLVLCLSLIFLITPSNKVLAAKTEYVPGQVIVKYKNNHNTNPNLKKRQLKSTDNNYKIKEYLSKNTALLTINDGTSVEDQIAIMKQDPNIEYVEPNYRRYPNEINSNDPYRELLWALDNQGQTINGVSGKIKADISATAAWELVDKATTSSSQETIVALIDSGVAYNHHDIASSMWDGASCLDDSGNYLGDCQHGYDFASMDKNPLPENSSHGTHIAGIIAAGRNNNIGVIGVASGTKIMSIRFGYDIISEIKAIDFAIENGAKIINASYGGAEFSQAEYDALERFRQSGGLVIAAAGNDHQNNDLIHNYPSDYDLDNIITVAASDQNDNLASFSNYGTSTVDIAAPGVNIFSTTAESFALKEDFENVATSSLPIGWTAHGTGSAWTIIDETSWGKVLDTNPDKPYSVADSYIESPEMNLSLAATSTLEFKVACDTPYEEFNWTDYIILEVGVGENFSELARWNEFSIDPDSDPSGYAQKQFSFNLGPEYATSSVRFRFHWISNEDDNNYGGCILDAINVYYYGDGTNENYKYLNGTSMAAPYVSGLAALIFNQEEGITYNEVRDLILEKGDVLSSLENKIATGKRINVYKSLEALIDYLPPILSVPDTQTFEATSQETEPLLILATATDDQDLMPTISYSPHTFPLGTSTVFWTATDKAGNSATSSSKIEIVDTIAPQIELLGQNNYIIYIGSTFFDPGARAIDLVDGEVLVIATGTVKTEEVGSYNILYEAIDDHNNRATSSRLITVREVPTGARTIQANNILTPTFSVLVVDTNSPTSTTVVVPQNIESPELNLSALINTSSSSTTEVSLPTEIYVVASSSLGNVEIIFPSNLNITAASSTWNGIINLFKPKISPSVSLPTKPSHETKLSSIFDIGSEIPLSFNRAVRLQLPAQSGNLVGYIEKNNFYQITATCQTDSQSYADNLATDEACFIKTDDEIVIWTKHFTEFVVYYQKFISNNSGGGGGGGGGPSILYCSEITYSNWGQCQNSFRFRTVLNNKPSSCVLTSAQQISLSEKCQEELIIEDKKSDKTINVNLENLLSSNTKSENKNSREIIINNTLAEEEKRLIKKDSRLITRLAGHIILQVEKLGRAWYLDPASLERYYLADGESAFSALRKFGLGIKDSDLAKIPVGEINQLIMEQEKNKLKKSSSFTALTNRLKGKILIQVEQRGEAWYVNPKDGKRYYLANGEAAYNIMKFLSLGIKDVEIRKIPIYSKNNYKN